MSQKRQLSITTFASNPKQVKRNEESCGTEVKWKMAHRSNLKIKYSVILPQHLADEYLQKLENEIVYLSGNLSKVKVFGNWFEIPRKHSAYGDPGISYTYSGVTIAAKPWTETLILLRDKVEKLTTYSYNFVLVNRYADGNDKMGFHKDDEKELDPTVPIASLSLGAARDFVFKHQNSKEGIPNETILLTSGMLLLMEDKTNSFWYHGLPSRKKCMGLRINLTFRKIIAK